MATKTGQLTVDSGVSVLNNNTTLARAGEANPLTAATNFLAARGLGNGDFISVNGSDGFVDGTPVFFITAASALGAVVAKAKAKARKARKKAAKKSAKKAAKKSAKKSAKKASKKSAGKKGGAKKSSGARASSKRSAKKRASKKSKKGSR